jgi:pimeloyl-ACP methyl ester carboxylesterase
MRSQLPCSREEFYFISLLNCLGVTCLGSFLFFASLLAKCLDEEYILGSIASQIKRGRFKASDIPTLVINGNDDFVIDRTTHTRWSEQLKPGDHYRAIDNARHFFHHQEANQTADLLLSHS